MKSPLAGPLALACAVAVFLAATLDAPAGAVPSVASPSVSVPR